MISRVTENFFILSAYAKTQSNPGNTTTIGTVEKLVVYVGGRVVGIKFVRAIRLIAAVLIAALCAAVFNSL